MPDLKPGFNHLVAKYGIKREDIPEEWLVSPATSVLHQFALALGFSNEAALQHFLDQISTVALLSDASLKVIAINQLGLKLIGKPKEEVIGRNVFSVVKIGPDEAGMKNKVNERKTGKQETYQAEFTNDQGKTYIISVSASPVFSSTKNFLGSFSLANDITELVKARTSLETTNEEMERSVERRTKELSVTIYQLKNEIKERQAARQALVESEKRFRDIFFNSPEAIFVENEEGIVLDANDEAAKLHELSREQLIGKSVFELVPESIHPIIRKRQPQISTGDAAIFESQVLTGTGKIIPVEIKSAVIPYQEGKAMLLHVRDISERKRSQMILQSVNEALEKKVQERTEALQGQRNYLQQVIDVNPNIIFVKDHEGRITLVNQAVSKFYGVPQEQVIGSKNDVLISDTKELEMLREQDRMVMESGKEIFFPEHSFKNKVTGEIRWLQTVKKPIVSEDGKTHSILGVSMDITEIRKAKEDLRLSEKLYREIARNLPNTAIWIVDRQQQFVLVEGQLLPKLSVAKEDLEGKSLTQVHAAWFGSDFQQTIQQVFNGSSISGEHEWEGRQLITGFYPIKDEKGEVVYAMTIMLDISDLMSIQAELEKRAVELQRSNEELERFAYVASHDLQGPLRTIASYLRLIEQRFSDKIDQEGQDFIHFSVEAAKRMQRIIQDLLNYSRINSSPRPFQVTDLNELTQNIIRILDSNIRTRNAVVRIEGTLPKIVAQPVLLSQLLQNLIDNGIKFKKEGQPEVVVSAMETDADWIIKVSDNGIGIGKDYADKIFQIFQRLHTEAEFPGTGIGLAISKKIVQIHQGNIWFESEPGKGTTFFVAISKKLQS